MSIIEFISLLLIVISRQDELWGDPSFTNTVYVLFFCITVRIQKKTHVALMSTLIKFERMSYFFSQNCWNKSQIPCKRKLVWKTPTLEPLCTIWGFEGLTDPRLPFLMGLVFKWFGLGIQWDEKTCENSFWKYDKSGLIFLPSQGLWHKLDCKILP